MESTIIQNAAHATLKVKRDSGIAITTEIIREEVMRFQNMYSLEGYPSINWERIINELESHYTITIGVSETLYNHRIPWVRNYKQNNPNLSDFPFWNNFNSFFNASVRCFFYLAIYTSFFTNILNLNIKFLR